jgi:hypothetical protein
MTNNPIYIDFSVDGNYLLYKDIDKEIIIDSRTFNSLNSRGYSKIEWMNDGIKISGKLSEIINIYNKE